MTVPKPRIEVVCGIIFNTRGEILIAERPAHTSFAGWWEFPGGKVEAGEEHVVALAREIREEVGIEIIDPQFFRHIAHEDEEKILELDFWRIHKFSGIARGLESQKIRWVLPRTLKQFEILIANRQLVEELMHEK